MQLEILLPFSVFLASETVSRIVVVTPSGWFGLLPHRLDCVTAVAPGILSYSTPADGEVNVAIDRGVLIKTGAQVRICVRRAMSGAGLGDLQRAVTEEFLELDEREQSIRSALAALESGFIRHLAEVQRA
ncbi:MAG: F-type H+-transporting ATPase subunit epsilon [Gammaproteobacteria bacterium]|nr:F-type H+-transporting ATPase subunit epsilon [Gammaproteobacteria bacterium]